MQAEHFTADNEAYHASPGISNSMISDFIKDRHKYKAKHVDRWWKGEQTASQSLGSLVHDFMLTPGFADTIAVIPDGVLSSNGARIGKAWKEWQEDHEGYTILKQDEHDHVQRYCEAIRQNPTAIQVIEQAKTEYNIRWTDDETGLYCRCRHDIFHPRVDADIKTCQDNSPQGFAKAIFNWGYHRQRAHYGEGSMRMRGGEVVPFWFFAVTPFSCKVYQLNEEFEQRGKDEVRKALDDIKACMDSGYWGDGTEADPVLLPMPRWAHTQSDYELEEV